MNHITLSEKSLMRPGLRLCERLMIWLVNLTQPWYAFFWKRYRRPWESTGKNQSRFPTGSLGHALFQFIKAGRMELMPRFEEHDVFHVLLQYGTSVREEACMQFCLIGSGKRSLYCLGAAILALAVFPEYWNDFRTAYRRGRKTRPFYRWDFEFLLREPVWRLRALIFGKNMEEIPIWF